MDIQEDLSKSCENGSFLEAVYRHARANFRDMDMLAAALEALHNSGRVNVIEEFSHLDQLKASDFFLTLRALECALPKLNASVVEVMACVLKLYRQAGGNVMAGRIVDKFMEYCVNDPSRPSLAIAAIEKDPEQFADLLPAILIAGSRIEHSTFLGHAVRLSLDRNPTLQHQAIFALGSVMINDGSPGDYDVLAALEQAIRDNPDDAILASAISSGVQLLSRGDANSSRITTIVMQAMAGGGDAVLHAVSSAVAFKRDKLPCDLVKSMCDKLLDVNVSNTASINNIDHALNGMFEDGQLDLGIKFLERLLLRHQDSIDVGALPSAAHALLTNQAGVNKIITRWLLDGRRVLGDAVASILEEAHGLHICLEIDSSEMGTEDRRTIIFLARKAIGYLIDKPTLAAAVVLSLMQRAEHDEELIAKLGALLFSPLLINYSSSVHAYLESQSESRSEKTKAAIDSAIKELDKYLDGLRSVPYLPALQPSESQVQAYHRHMAKLMSDSYKEAQAKSLLSQLFSKRVLLYGTRSIIYVQGPNGERVRSETPLSSHDAEIELPRMAKIDPYGFDYMRRVLRNERLQA